MGQFSWNCAVCEQEVMHGTQPGYQKFTDAVILWPNGDRRSGRYEDGYGVIAGVNLVEQHGGWRLVHQSCFDPSIPTDKLFASFKGKSSKYGGAPDQGWWPGERVAVERYGQPDHSELTKDQNYVCIECNRTWTATWSGGICPFGCVRPKNYRASKEDLAADYYSDSIEMVEPFRETRITLPGETYGHYVRNDGIAICRNEQHERPDWAHYHANREDLDGPPMVIEPCFVFGEPQQTRVGDVDSSLFRDDPEGTMVEVTPTCRFCKSKDMEIVALTKSTI